MLGKAAIIVVSVTVILGVIATCSVALRLYCRKLQKLPLGGDDYCIVIALILSIAMSILADYTASTTGVGDASYVPDLNAVIFALKAYLAAELAQIAAMGFVKVSLLLFYRRIFVTRGFVWSSNILIGVITCFTISIMLVAIFCKWPVYEQWNPMAPYNVNISAFLITFVAGNSLFDVLTLILPLAALRSLQMDTHRKVVLATIFSLGSICIVASLCRLYYSIKSTKVPQTSSSLFQVPYILNTLWACIEPPVFIITGCFLNFGPLYRASSNGSTSLFRSLRSRLLRRSMKSLSDTSAHAESRDKKHPWMNIHEVHQDNSATARAQWELTEMSTPHEDQPPQTSAAALV